MAITFRQLIQSLKDYDNQYASAMPVAPGAEASCWGIQYIWFKDGVLHLGQHDDEGYDIGLIVREIEKCLPEVVLDEIAVVKIGAVGWGASKGKIFDKYGEDAEEFSVKSSEVKRKGEDFCKWILKFEEI